MISQKAKYAFHALIALARANDTLLAREIADQENIPRKFLKQILLDLKRHGILQSRRGRTGGYALLEPANRITFGKVLRIVDGPVAPLPCLSRIAIGRARIVARRRTARSGASSPRLPKPHGTCSTAPRLPTLSALIYSSRQ